MTVGGAGSTYPLTLKTACRVRTIIPQTHSGLTARSKLSSTLSFSSLFSFSICVPGALGYLEAPLCVPGAQTLQGHHHWALLSGRWSFLTKVATGSSGSSLCYFNKTSGGKKRLFLRGHPESSTRLSRARPGPRDHTRNLGTASAPYVL